MPATTATSRARPESRMTQICIAFLAILLTVRTFLHEKFGGLSPRKPSRPQPVALPSLHTSHLARTMFSSLPSLYYYIQDNLMGQCFLGYPVYIRLIWLEQFFSWLPSLYKSHLARTMFSSLPSLLTGQFDRTMLSSLPNLHTGQFGRTMFSSPHSLQTGHFDGTMFSNWLPWVNL